MSLEFSTYYPSYQEGAVGIRKYDIDTKTTPYPKYASALTIGLLTILPFQDSKENKLIDFSQNPYCIGETNNPFTNISNSPLKLHSLRTTSEEREQFKLLFSNNLKTLNRLFNVINLYELEGFLIDNPELFSPLVDCKLEISKLFDNVIPSIGVITDVEIPEWRRLIVTIPFIDNFDENIIKWEKLLNNWAFYQSNHFKNNVSIILE